MPTKTHGKKRKTRHRGVYRLPGGRWWIRVRATEARTGRSRETTKTMPAETTEAEALVTLGRLKAQLRAGEPLERAPARISLSDFAEQWCEDAGRRLKPSTAEHYADVLASRVLPHLGDLYVDALTRRDFERWVAWAERTTRKDGLAYSRDTIRGWWRVLCLFVRDACAEHGLPDPIVRVRGPRGRAGGRRDKRTLTAEELGAVLEVVERELPERFAEVYVLAYTGMRPGELYSLQWTDIDEARGRLLIRRSHRRGVVGTTKTGDPREAALTARMAELLRAHRRWLLEAQHPGLERGLVFPSRTGGHRGPESLHKPLRRAGEQAGVDVRVGPQVLRRTFNTLMLLGNVDRVVLRSQMGHCSEAMTQRYAGVPVAAKIAAVEALESRTRE